MELKSDLSKAKVGDWVCDSRNGWQRIRAITKYLIRNTSGSDFFRNGKWVKDDKYPTCFPVGQVPQSYLDLFGPPPCEFKHGEPVWVWNKVCVKLCRVFKEYRNGKYCTYNTNGETVCWKHCASWDNGNLPVEQEKGTPALPSHS